jgi:integrase
LVDCQPGGRLGKRVKRLFLTQAEAKRFLHHIEAEAIQQPWNPKPKDKRKLSELITTWYEAHGQYLSAGANTKSRLVHFADQLGDPSALELSAKMFSEWRILVTTRNSKPLKAGGVNRVLAYAKAMFSTLKEIGEWDGDNPLERVSPIKAPASELRYLEEEEIAKLLSSASQSENDSVWLCTVLALSTGARWSEAEQLTIRQLIPGAVRFHTKKDSKGGKWRTVPISEELEEALRKGASDTDEKGAIFSRCYSAFREAVARAEIELPDGQLTHVLRHTFATTFLSSGGDLRTLKELLGHESIQMTMRYAHLVESHLNQARVFNPIARLPQFNW